METSAFKRKLRFDAPFWAVSLLAFLCLVSIGCFGVAAAQTAGSIDVAILTTDNCPPPPDL